MARLIVIQIYLSPSQRAIIRRIFEALASIKTVELIVFQHQYYRRAQT